MVRYLIPTLIETKNQMIMTSPPILTNKYVEESSVFTAENLLRESRRQKKLPLKEVPAICILDPDGDIVRALVAERRAEKDPGWACYHTDLYTFSEGEINFGIIGCAVGASFAVLVAEELFASGCELLISMTSAGQILEIGDPPYFVLIEKALRDEGTSYHYLPPAEFSSISPQLRSILDNAFANLSLTVYRGATWSTDAPFRETEPAIQHCKQHGIIGVEMEAAALYAFAEARNNPVVCIAYITNKMARACGDFEKGNAGGSHDALEIISAVAKAWISK